MAEHWEIKEEIYSVFLTGNAKLTTLEKHYLMPVDYNCTRIISISKVINVRELVSGSIFCLTVRSLARIVVTFKLQITTALDTTPMVLKTAYLGCQ